MADLNIVAVVLAAGNSSRMGQSKMALKWGESTVLETTLANIQRAKVESVLLVTGGYRELVERLPLVQAVSRVFNPDFADGEMLSSMKVALQTIKKNEHSDGVLVLPGDMPLVTTNLLNQCIDEWAQTADHIVAPTINGKRGHPVIFPMEVFEQFETLLAEKSPRDLLKKQRSRLKLFPIEDQAIRIDVDTPAEYEKHRPRNTD